MEVYLVGGAVRDELLGLAIKERDWVVVGSSPEEMLAQGYKQVGKDFPVFLHPQSNEEYALARTERKHGRGYYGFEVHASPDVSLEEDLMRRDLTINAIAKSPSGELIDPYSGLQDINAKVLRHVSGAFIEDPLRVLRVARFAAKLKTHGFTIADETLQLMRHIVSLGELIELAPERIWQETQRALETESPSEFFSVLHAVHALAQTHTGISDRFANHQARATGLTALDEISSQQQEPCVRFAALLGGLYFRQQENSYHDIQKLYEQLPLSNACKDLLRLTTTLQYKCYAAFTLNEKQLLSLLQKLDTRRKSERFVTLLSIFSTIKKAATNETCDAQMNWLQLTAKTIDSVDVGKWVLQGLKNAELADHLESAQLALIQRLIQDRNHS
ncbi:MAG: multifunctional CCA tRNA nucleotidyl transferase/2'3'-cyclic phosphodiesterase/2'nucleotidase/phosphatase [Gammaproteobacteria bacterium]|nr:multifunctional CCA tRNA nucleotidyl transferase/2'3'-cyclic phosphodiesterase/2'nucleotidase/phosphatase [Gammaproteobacteria bacterium]